MMLEQMVLNSESTSLNNAILWQRINDDRWENSDETKLCLDGYQCGCGVLGKRLGVNMVKKNSELFPQHGSYYFIGGHGERANS